MHPQCFPQFIRKNDVKYQQFCLSFVQTIIDLAIRMPDGFYKPVTIILMLIASDYPSFLVQYYAVLIDSLPLRFIQFRNIILNAAPQEFSPDKNPTISFQYIDALETKALILNVKPFLRLEIPENVSTASNIQFIISTLRRAASQSEYTPSLFWQFALYCISKASAAIPTEKIGCASEFAALPIISMFKQLASAFGVDADCLLINGIIDQIRFPSSHTVIASEILFTLFEESPSYVRELIYTEIVRRLLCVTQPPRSVKAIYLRITSKYKQQLTKMFNESDQKNAFLKISSVIDA